jgi:hypothetical protein
MRQEPSMSPYVAVAKLDRGGETRREELRMKKFTLAAATATLLLGSVAFAAAQDGDKGMSGFSPGHEMQQKGSVRGQPSASGYALGHRDSDDRGMLRDREDRMDSDREHARDRD